MGRVTVYWGDAGLTCMRNGDYHGAIIEADLALPIACALPPPFLLWLVAYCVFNAPLYCPLVWFGAGPCHFARLESPNCALSLIGMGSDHFLYDLGKA